MPKETIHAAASRGDLDAVREMVSREPGLVNLDDEHEWRPIFHAGLRRQIEVVEFLINNGADLSAHDGYVMHYAGQVPNNEKVISLLVAYGALDAHTEPVSELTRQFIHAVFLDNPRRVRSMLRESPHLGKEQYSRGDTA